MTLTYTPTTDNPYYLTLGDAVNNDNVEIQLNGKALPTMPSHRHTIVVPLPAYQKGQKQTLTFVLKKDDLWLQNVSLYSADKDLIKSQAQSLQEHGLQVKKDSETEINGKINMPKGQGLLMTTIPNADGWHVFVDGK